MGTAAWWLDDTATVFSAREQAYRLYRNADDPHGAARTATALAMDYVLYRGEDVVAGGWLRRAHRLLDGLEPAPEHGLLALLEGLFAIELENDPTAAGRLGAKARKVGRALKVPDIEMLGLALEGLALVSEGQVADGMRRLDEATAAATSGEMEDPVAIGFTCCYLLYACERVRDFERAAQWCVRIREFSERTGFRTMLSICQAHYAGVLISRGLWGDAEAELAVAGEDLTANRPGLAAEALLRLGELRCRQGRVDEAAELFGQIEFHPYAQLGLASVALEREQYAGAVERAERFLRHVPAENLLERVRGIEMLVRALVRLGELERARAQLGQIESAAAAADTPLMQGAARAAAGTLLRAAGELDQARRELEHATDLYYASGVPFEAAQARLELASVLGELGRIEEAATEAARSSAAFTEIGAELRARRASEMLDRLRAGATDAADTGGLTAREIEVLRLIAEGLTDQEIADRLVLSEHTVHRHVANIRTRLGATSRAAAATWAARKRII